MNLTESTERVILHLERGGIPHALRPSELAAAVLELRNELRLAQEKPVKPPTKFSLTDLE